MRLLVFYIGLAGLYLLFAGDTSWPEAVAAASVPVPAVVLAYAMRAGGERRFRLVAPWGRLLAKPMLHLFTDSWFVGGRLLAALFGADPVGDAVAQPVTALDEAGPGAAFRRAALTLGISFSPNSYVLRVPPDGEELLLHRLAPRRLPARRKWPL